MTRAEAPFALRRLYRSLSPRTLERLRVPLGDLIDVLVEDDDGELVAGDAGVNLALTDDPRGLAVGIALWAGAQAFEEIDVQWGGNLALSHFLLPGELDAPEGILYLRVPLRRLQDGQATVSYTVWHADGNGSESAPIRVLVKRTRPGGRDDDAELPGHQGLVPAGLAPELIENGIGPIEAAAGVEVTLAAYEHMRVRDKIELDWGGERLEYLVTDDDVGQDLTLVVEEALILAAGDGEIKLAWKVTDEVLNSSRDADERPWSASTTVEVHAGDAQLFPPYVKVRDEYVDEVIDLDELGLDDVTVEVFRDPYHFAVGNWVELFWNGLTAEGEPVRYRQQAQVERVPGAITFFVPNSQAQQLGGGRVVLYYQVKAGETTPPLHRSQRASRRIEGEGAGIGLRAPSVLEAVGGNLDPNLAEATIRVGAYPGIELGDVLTVVFSGTRADGSEVFFENTRNVTSGQIEAGEILRYVPGEYIAALDGRRAEVYYLVNGRRSETLGLIVGELQATLPAPSVLEVEEGVLDPANVGAQGATLQIPLYPDIALDDQVTYQWQGSEAGGSTSDQSVITSLSEALLFDVPKEYVEANLNGSVEVRYSVERDGHPGQMSQVYAFRVGVLALELGPASVVEAPGGVLDPLDAQSGVTVEVSYAGMAASDRITLHWRGTAGIGSIELGPVDGNESGTLTFPIEAALVGANIGQSNTNVQVSYSVVRGGDDAKESPELRLTVIPLTGLPSPTIFQAVGNQLDLGSFSGHATVKVQRWPFIAQDQQVWLECQSATQTEHLLNGHRVSAGEVSAGLSVTLSRTFLEGLAQNSSLSLHLRVAFAGGVEQAVIFPQSITYQISLDVPGPLPAPSLEGAQNGHYDPMLGQQGARMYISYPGMRTTDRIQPRWLGTAGAGTPSLAERAGSTSGTLQVDVPASAVGANIKHEVTLSYQVKRGSQPWLSSPDTVVQILEPTAAALPKPSINQAVGNQLNLGSFSGNATVEVQRWPFIAQGQRVWLECRSANQTQPLLNDHRLTASEASAGLSVALPRTFLEGLAENSSLTLHLRVAFGGDTNQSVQFPSSITYTLIGVEPAVTLLGSNGGATKTALPADWARDRRTCGVTVLGRPRQYVSFHAAQNTEFFEGVYFDNVTLDDNGFGQLMIAGTSTAGQVTVIQSGQVTARLNLAFTSPFPRDRVNGSYDEYVGAVLASGAKANGKSVNRVSYDTYGFPANSYVKVTMTGSARIVGFAPASEYNISLNFGSRDGQFDVTNTRAEAVTITFTLVGHTWATFSKTMTFT